MRPFREWIALVGIIAVFAGFCIAIAVTFTQYKDQGRSMIKSGYFEVEIHIESRETIKGFITKDNFYNYNKQEFIIVKNYQNIDQAIVKSKSIKAIDKYYHQF